MALKRIPILFALFVVVLWFALGRPEWWQLWRTADQQGAMLFEQGLYMEAASHFIDQRWKAVSLYEAGEYERAAELFARQRNADGYFNQGNALAQLELYALAANSYRKALALKSGWEAAVHNLELVELLGRQPSKDQDRSAGEEARLDADGLVFDLKADAAQQGEDQVIADGNGLSREQIQQQWLRRLSVSPANFLKLKFAFQKQRSYQGSSDE